MHAMIGFMRAIRHLPVRWQVWTGVLLVVNLLPPYVALPVTAEPDLELPDLASLAERLGL